VLTAQTLERVSLAPASVPYFSGSFSVTVSTPSAVDVRPAGRSLDGAILADHARVVDGGTPTASAFSAAQAPVTL